MDSAPKMVIRIVFVLGPDRLDKAALRGGDQARSGQRQTVQRCFTAAASQHVLMYCVWERYALQKGTAQGVVEAAFLSLTYKGR